MLSFSAEACAILHALCWSRQHQQVCHFSSLLLLSDSLFLSYLKLCGRSIFSLLPLFRLQWIPGSDTTELAIRGALLASPLSVVVSLLFSWTGGVLSHLNSLTHKFPRFPPRNLCSLVMLAVSSLVYAATDTAFCRVLNSLGLAESRILPAAPVDTRPRTPLISFCIVQLRTLCAAHSLATLCLFTTSGPDPGELPGFWGSMVFRHAPIPRKGSGNQQQQQQLLSCCLT